MSAFVNVGTGGNDATGTTIATAATSLTAGNTIAVGVVWTSATTTVTGVTDTAGNTYTQVSGSFMRSANNDATDIWVATNATGNASNVVTAAYSATSPFRRIKTHQYSGLATTSVSDGGANGFTAAGTSISTGSMTATTSDGVVFAIMSSNSAQTYTAGTSFTLRGTVQSTDTQSEDRILAATGSYTASVTAGSSARLFISAATLKGLITPGTALRGSTNLMMGV